MLDNIFATWVTHVVTVLCAFDLEEFGLPLGKLSLQYESKLQFQDKD